MSKCVEIVEDIDYMSNYVEIVETKGTITNKRYKRGCTICGREKVLINYKGFKACMNCLSILEFMKVEDEDENRNKSRGYH